MPKRACSMVNGIQRVQSKHLVTARQFTLSDETAVPCLASLNVQGTAHLELGGDEGVPRTLLPRAELPPRQGSTGVCAAPGAFAGKAAVFSISGVGHDCAIAAGATNTINRASTVLTADAPADAAGKQRG
eukprot:2223666-Pleurochrysis_carterae.AAC.6